MVPELAEKEIEAGRWQGPIQKGVMQDCSGNAAAGEGRAEVV